MTIVRRSGSPRPWLRLVVPGVVLSLAFGACGRGGGPVDPDQAYARGVMDETYQWIRDTVSPQTGLPYDNHRQDEFTSSTNIGLYVASVGVAAHLGREDRAEAIRRVERCLDAVAGFKTYKGWSQCWHSVKDGKPSPHDLVASTLDLGNYYAGWIIARQALPELNDRITAHLETMNWADLYDADKNLLYGGYNFGQQAFVGGWYLDQIGTDARLAGFLAIATEECPPRLWDGFKRPLIRHDGLAYFEPGWMGGGLFMQMISGIFLDERGTPLGAAAADFAYAQILLARAIDAPVWGWSSSDSPKDGYLGWGGMRRNVVTPHATALTSMYYPRRALANLRKLEALGARAPIEVGGAARRYGFRDAIDWTTGAVTNNYLVLDQAMLYLSLCNSFEDGVVWKLFQQDPLVQRGMALIGEFGSPSGENAALYRERDLNPLPPLATATAGSDTFILVDEFDDPRAATNLLGGKAEAWNRDETDQSQGCRASVVTAGAGRTGRALALDYDVESPNAAWCGYRTDLNGVDGRGANALVLDLRFDPALGNPGSVKIELTGPAGAATYRLGGFEPAWKRHVILLSDMEGMNIAWSKIGSLVLVFEDGRAADKTGRLLIDRITLERLAPEEIEASRLAAKYTIGLVEGFESHEPFTTSGWEGTTIRAATRPGRTGQALEIAYDLAATRQWVQVQRGVVWRLPPQRVITFDLFVTGAKNAIELKFTDADGSVFGCRLVEMPPPGTWETVRVDAARFKRLWGGDDQLDGVVSFGVAVASDQGEGGRGVVRIDNLRVDPAPAGAGTDT